MKKNQLALIATVSLLLALSLAAPVAAQNVFDSLENILGADNLGEFYENNGLFVDLIIYLFLFVYVAQFAFKKQEGFNKVAGIMGIALAVSAAIYEASSGIRLGDIGPFAVGMALALFGYAVYSVIKQMGGSTGWAAAAGFLLAFGLTSFVAPELFGVLNDTDNAALILLNAALWIAFLAALAAVAFGFGKWILSFFSGATLITPPPAPGTTPITPPSPPPAPGTGGTGTGGGPPVNTNFSPTFNPTNNPTFANDPSINPDFSTGPSAQAAEANAGREEAINNLVAVINNLTELLRERQKTIAEAGNNPNPALDAKIERLTILIDESERNMEIANNRMTQWDEFARQHNQNLMELEKKAADNAVEMRQLLLTSQHNNSGLNSAIGLLNKGIGSMSSMVHNIDGNVVSLKELVTNFSKLLNRLEQSQNGKTSVEITQNLVIIAKNGSNAHNPIINEVEKGTEQVTTLAPLAQKTTQILNGQVVLTSRVLKSALLIASLTGSYDTAKKKQIALIPVLNQSALQLVGKLKNWEHAELTALGVFHKQLLESRGLWMQLVEISESIREAVQAGNTRAVLTLSAQLGAITNRIFVLLEALAVGSHETAERIVEGTVIRSQFAPVVKGLNAGLKSLKQLPPAKEIPALFNETKAKEEATKQRVGQLHNHVGKLNLFNENMRRQLDLWKNNKMRAGFEAVKRNRLNATQLNRGVNPNPFAAMGRRSQGNVNPSAFGIKRNREAARHRNLRNKGR